MRISDWSSDVCSSDLPTPGAVDRIDQVALVVRLDVLELEAVGLGDGAGALHVVVERGRAVDGGLAIAEQVQVGAVQQEDRAGHRGPLGFRSEEHTSELQSPMRISYAVFCLKKKKTVSIT